MEKFGKTGELRRAGELVSCVPKEIFLSSSTLTREVRSGQFPGEADVALGKSTSASICRFHRARIQKG